MNTSSTEVAVTDFLENQLGVELNLELLLRPLVDYVNKSLTSYSYQPESESPEVIFETYLDGQHYALVRISSPISKAVNLSPREGEIARLIARGLPNKAIATILEISPWTVNTYLRRIFVKLEVSSRAEMIARIRKDELFVENLHFCCDSEGN